MTTIQDYVIVYADDPRIHAIRANSPYIQGTGHLRQFDLASTNCPAVMMFMADPIQDIMDIFDGLDETPDPYDAMSYATTRFDDIEEGLAFQDWEESKCQSGDWEDDVYDN